jgi:hypothetical protein
MLQPVEAPRTDMRHYPSGTNETHLHDAIDSLDVPHLAVAVG